MPYDSANKKLYIDRENNKGITPEEVGQCIQDFRVNELGQTDISIFLDEEDTKVNGFSLNKPFRWARWGYGLDAIGDAEKAAARAAVRQGLAAVTVTKILKATIGRATFVSSTLEDCLAEVNRWKYLPPRGGASEPFRIPDFDGYLHKAIPPDSGWSEITIDSNKLAEMRATTMTVSNTGDYAGYNFKLQPMYNGAAYNAALYQSFAMRFGFASGESIGTITNMDIPINAVVSLDGNYRIVLAVWIPSWGDSGGWGMFASRMTVAQYFKENLGTQLSWLLPDLATNPFVADLMASYVTNNGGYATFYAVPLLVKDLGINYADNGKFMLRPVDGTVAYCMMSGMRDIPIICGEPTTPRWFRVSYDSTSNSIAGFIENIDPDSSHTFGYTYTIYINGVAQTTGSSTVALAPLEKRQVAGAPSGGGLNITVTTQDGELVE